MDNFHFSVLLSVYCKEKPNYLQLALQSIWDSQTLKPSEIIIVKDGKLTEELELVLSTFAKIAPVKFVINEKNMGLTYSLNKGLKECSYNLVARMDTDDICFFNRFEKQIKYLQQHPEVDVLGGGAIKIDELGNEIELMIVPIEHNKISKLIWTCPFIHPSVMYKKEKVMSIGNYNPNAGVRQDDYELWFRCAINNFNFANLSEPLLYYRFFSNSVKKNNIKVGIDRFKVGFKGCRKLKFPFIAYIGVSVPLIRSLLPYPLNVWFNTLMIKYNPRFKI